MSSQPQTASRLITIPEVIRLTTCQKTKVYELIKAGVFRPVKIGRRTAFSEAEIHSWIEAQLASREA